MEQRGELCNHSTRRHYYDARNRLIAADSVNQYAHNALGQRAMKRTPVVTPPGSGEPDPDTLEQIAQLEAQAQAALDDATAEQQAANQSFATAAVHQQQADAHAANAAQNWLEAEQNWQEAAQNRAAYEENLADIAEAQAEIEEMQEDIQDLQDDLIDPATTPQDEAHNAPLLAEIASLEAEIQEEQLDIADDTADAEEDLADALDDEADAQNDQADAEEAEALAAQSQALANQHTQEGNAHLATAAQRTQQAADLQAQADALRNATPTTPQGGTLLFAYDEAGHLLGEYDATGNPIRQYVWLEDRPVAMLATDSATGNQVAYYIHSDHLNTPKAVTNENQSVVWRVDYEPFGKVTETVSNIEFNLRFAGQYQDDETGLHQNYFRNYDPATGRYNRPDPIGFVGGNNNYRYANASPVMFTDRLGLYPDCERFQIGLEKRSWERYEDDVLLRQVLPAPIPTGGSLAEEPSLRNPKASACQAWY